jgi:hypothetical protein
MLAFVPPLPFWERVGVRVFPVSTGKNPAALTLPSPWKGEGTKTDSAKVTQRPLLHDGPQRLARVVNEIGA